jgi:uncharacterized protein YegJ (DUF2314 family)
MGLLPTLLPIVIALVLLIFFGLRYAPKPSNTALEVAADDPALVRAELDARAALPTFLQRLASPHPSDSEFMVKFRLRSGATPEQIWADVTRRADGRLVGVLANDPITHGYRIGQEVEIPEHEIMDWGYRSNGAMQGHFSTRVFLEHMPADVQAHTRREMGWTS